MPRRIRLVYSKDYAVDIGNHVFPTSKYNRIRERLLKESPFRNDIEIVTPDAACEKDVLAVHEPAYLDKLKKGTLNKDEILRLELPYSRELVRASLICCGGTILAARIAMEDKIGIHIGGGFHHAFPDHGEGFCVLNDIAISISCMINNNIIKKALIIDCDLHQGNGTASIFTSRPDVFTFSIHQENNYPFFKPRSTLDIGLHDRASDKEYLKALYENVPKIISSFKPEFLLYVAGADPYKEDRIGGLALTKEGLRKRDVFIYSQAKSYSLPVAVVLAGGYAINEEDTVDIHYNTVVSGLSEFYPPSQNTTGVSPWMNATRCFGGCHAEAGRRIPPPLDLRSKSGGGKERDHGRKPVGFHAN
ncbi:MAG: histone deacetylase [Candidatus Omnitrophica bacterium]|nr:histone deacetylase [Candidatus Omnitrophota bacterium]